MTKFVNPFEDFGNYTVSRPGEPYVLFPREPEGITTETLAAGIAQGIAQALTAMAKRKQNKTETDAASDTLKPNNR